MAEVEIEWLETEATDLLWCSGLTGVDSPSMKATGTLVAKEDRMNKNRILGLAALTLSACSGADFYSDGAEFEDLQETSDHGFLAEHDALNDDALNDAPSAEGDAIVGEGQDGAHSQLGSLSQAVSADFLDCRERTGAEGLACRLILARVNEELSAAGLSLDRNGLLFSFNDPTDEKISTGHSCTVTAKVTNKKAEARFSSNTRLQARGDALDEPFVIKVAVPVSFSGQVDVTQRFGTRFLGSCSNFGKDSYSFKGSLATTADIIAAFDLNPSFTTNAKGDFQIALAPRASAAMNLRNTRLNFRASGVSPITPAVTFALGFSSTLARGARLAIEGESLSQLERAAAFDIGVSVGLSLLSGPVQGLVTRLLESEARRKIERRAQHFGSELSTSLNTKLRRALKVDSSGRRIFIVDRQYVSILRNGGLLDDILKEPPVSDECRWSFSFSAPRTGGGGLGNHIERGRRCTRSNQGERFQHRAGSTTFTYVCTPSCS